MDRTLNMLKKNMETTVDEDKGPHNLVISKISGLCNDLAEDEVDDLEDHVDLQICEPRTKKIRRKKVQVAASVRRSTRVRNQNKKS